MDGPDAATPIVAREDLPEGWEAWLAFFTASLPEPVEQAQLPDGSMLFRAGDPGEVIVHLMPGTITVSLFTVRSAPGGEPLVVARPVGRVLWRRLELDHATHAVDALIKAARSTRRASFRLCDVCEELKPPEAMREESLCESCAAIEPGR
jgi:hypothetical protein